MGSEVTKQDVKSAVQEFLFETALIILESKEHNFIVLETNRSTKWLVQKDRRKSSKHGENRQYVC
ncbi:hypothetical protein SAMN05443574_1246 [Haloarcula vallismortis]|uniref:Uncharacterized protein n=2 Tax=Haloarcula vallismortis TaxID=28442 RepID=M0JNM9_HALVA|nr:hypothetical protein C437_04880 [Haloarcula vallismortis ATCC 29715]SDX27644.1 hypothetical protein SAMN05443574_1246 [Haloarcula vallismortis]